jgi:hypothetical protein
MKFYTAAGKLQLQVISSEISKGHFLFVFVPLTMALL